MKRVSAENNNDQTEIERKRRERKKNRKGEKEEEMEEEEEEDKQGRKTNSAPTNRTPFVSINLVPSERQIPRFFEFLSNVSSNENEYSNRVVKSN